MCVKKMSSVSNDCDVIEEAVGDVDISSGEDSDSSEEEGDVGGVYDFSWVF